MSPLMLIAGLIVTGAGVFAIEDTFHRVRGQLERYILSLFVIAVGLTLSGLPVYVWFMTTMGGCK